MIRGSNSLRAKIDKTLTYYEKSIGDEYFEVVPIIVFDKDKESYVFKNSISDRFFSDLYMSSTLNDEKEELQKIFRPHDYLVDYLERNKSYQFIPRDELEVLADELGLNKAFINFDDILAGFMETR